MLCTDVSGWDGLDEDDEEGEAASDESQKLIHLLDLVNDLEENTKQEVG